MMLINIHNSVLETNILALKAHILFSVYLTLVLASFGCMGESLHDSEGVYLREIRMHIIMFYTG